ncbi:transglutaminase family protein [Janibacter sp. GS2]|uniref:transglutaminase family protein n=1 Tax=Janibacter sp. GS2 TaxID=3442646 RepID=UPI003EC01408
MTIRVALEHRTSYSFAEPVQVYPHTIRLRPAPHSRTPIPSYSLRVEPANHFINWQQDPFGNWLARVVFPEKVERLEITVDLLADMTVINPFDFFVEDWATTFPFVLPEQLRADLAPYLHPIGDDGGTTAPEVVAWLEDQLPDLLSGPADAAPGRGTPIVDFVVGLNRAIRGSVDYTVRLEAGVQTPARTLQRGIGSCRDSAWLLVAALRHLGLAARFVSGYLVQLTADLGAVGDGADGPAEDFTDLHAWAEVYIPGAGWVGLDATSGLLCGEGHIPLSATPHPASAAPITGSTGPVEVSFDFANSVTRLAEDPRVTRPLDATQWARVDELGEAVDALLAKGDVRLTMAGAPTFVAAGGTSDPQWHTAADGEEKQALAMALAVRLSRSGTLRHHGPGRGRPGVPLPGWQITLADRADGLPLWHDPTLLDSPWGVGRLDSGSPEAADAARDLATGIARRLGVDPATPAVEHRDGHLFVVLPALEDLEAAIELVAAIEAAAAELGQPVVLEGHPLPDDDRVRTTSVTPEPGVITVGVAPTASWHELVEQTESIHEHARQIHLASEKFDLNGSHTPTGGGNHLTLGGATPADSPLLRRPDLLRSLLTYWQHHPALSYLFSGRFIGPSSPAPRVDEGRPDALHELEIAFAQMDHLLAREPVEEHGAEPWLADRLLRHLLTDVTGNSHRSELCIDALFAPGPEQGRLGLLEMRGLEMPPHPRMALLQALLVRSLVARFWAEPYSGPLVRWGTRLHDRYLLPAFVAADLRDVIEDVNRYLESAGAGRIDPAWFDSFLEFRFPRLGDTLVGGVELELRTALEPWPVLGEAGPTGPARTVDSSVEKLQVRAVGLVEGRHVVTCNGVPVPMAPVAEHGWGGPVGSKGSTGAFVGGVRYRARTSPSALHPTIGVHAPLVFDLVDRWSGRSLGGFTHHVTHPGGVSYDSYPVNAAAAESRRAARFVTDGHTGGPIDVAALPDPLTGLGPAVTDFPVTLDLRRFPGTDGGTGDS